jgi:hypothetical protein
MKTMLQKLQTLGQKAAHIAQVVEQAPGKIAHARETIQLTAGQLQAARNELQQVATGLQVENDEDFTAALREVADNAAVFHEAGYDLAGIDLEVAHHQRLIVHLDHHTEVPEHTVRYLLTQNNSKITVASILSSIIKAESVAQKVHSPDMEYRGVLIHLGAQPGVRILWREIIRQIQPAQAAMKVSTQTIPTTPSLTNQPATASAHLPATSSFAQSSFFESAPRATTPAHSASIEVAAPTETHRSHFHTSKSLSGDWKKEAMDRLKSNPSASKYSR